MPKQKPPLADREWDIIWDALFAKRVECANDDPIDHEGIEIYYQLMNKIRQLHYNDK